MRFARFIAVTWLTLMCAFAPAHAEKRVALVVGNDRYANLTTGEQLQKAVNDARAVGGALRQIGFEVINGENLDRRALVRKLGELTQRVAPGDTAFFFFSGHGVAIDGVNYILPSDVPDVGAGQDTLLKNEALSEQAIIAELVGRGVRVAVVVLDACRTNPFSRPGSKGIGFAKGLAPPPQVQGVFSLYAASSGQTALDRLYDSDPNPNSVFSRVLVPALTRPGLDLTALAFDVREEVARMAKQAGYEQRPAYYDETIGGRVYLAGPPPVGSPPAVPPVAQDYISSAFSTGWKLNGKNFVFGSPYTVVNSLLEKPFNIPAYNQLPRAGEYDPDDIRYFVVRLGALPAVESALGNLAQGSKCLDDKSYVGFLFKNGNLFRMTLRLYRGRQCRSYDWVREALFGPIQRRQSLTGSKGNVSVLYHEDDRFSYLEIFQPGIAKDDDGFFAIPMAPPPW